MDISDRRVFSPGSLFKRRQPSDFVVGAWKICPLKNKILPESLGMFEQTLNLNKFHLRFSTLFPSMPVTEFEAVLT